MRRPLAAAFVALALAATPAVAENPVKKLLDSINECMDCVPSRCQILYSCEILP